MSNRTLSFGEYNKQNKSKGTNKHHRSNVTKHRTNLDGINLMLDKNISKVQSDLRYQHSLGRKGEKTRMLDEKLSDLTDLKKKTILDGKRSGGSKKTKKNKRKKSRRKSNLKKTIKKRKTRSKK